MKLRTCRGKFVFRMNIFEIVMPLDTEIACRLSSEQSGGRNSSIHGFEAFEFRRIEKLNA